MARNSTCFERFACLSSGIYSLCTQQWYMSYRFVDNFRAVYKRVWHIPFLNVPLLCVQWINSWWWTGELSETCRFSFQNKFVKLVHLVGFIIKKLVLYWLRYYSKGELLSRRWLKGWICVHVLTVCCHVSFGDSTAGLYVPYVDKRCA